MASRRVQPTKTKLIVDDLASDSEEAGLDFFASQQSSGSDDHECGTVQAHHAFDTHCVPGIHVFRFEMAIAEKLAGITRRKTIGCLVANPPVSQEER